MKLVPPISQKEKRKVMQHVNWHAESWWQAGHGCRMIELKLGGLVTSQSTPLHSHVHSLTPIKFPGPYSSSISQLNSPVQSTTTKTSQVSINQNVQCSEVLSHRLLSCFSHSLPNGVPGPAWQCCGRSWAWTWTWAWPRTWSLRWWHRLYCEGILLQLSLLQVREGMGVLQGSWAW